MNDSKLTLTPLPVAQGVTLVLSGPSEKSFPAQLGCLGYLVVLL